jgi:hypothetical protein
VDDVERGKSLSSGRRVLFGISAGLVVTGALAGYQVGVRSKRPPHFRRGGQFVSASQPPQSADPSTPLASTTLPPVAVPGAPTTTAAAAAEAAAPSAQSAAAKPSITTPPTAPVAAPRTSPGTSVPPFGTYTYQVQGTETATGFGSRSFPPTATMVAHHDGNLPADQVVMDLTYSSDHTERAIAAADGNGLSFVYEAGQVRFGPMAQTNQGDYRPPMVQVPQPLAVGTSRSGDTKVVDSSGSTERSEAWTTTVTGQETLVAAGSKVTAWVVRLERNSDPGSGQQVHRVRTYWYDPGRHIWVKYTEQMHGEQHYGGVAFTYDDDLTATLAGYQPAA